MVPRILCTVAVLALSGAVFMGFGPAPAGVNSPGIALLFGAMLVWFGWSAGYSYRRDSASRKKPDIIAIGAAPLMREEPTEREEE